MTVWTPEPGEISEKMWGEGSIVPCDEAISKSLILPLGLNKDMSMLDLSAGLGGRLRKTTDEFKVYITGLEPDRGIADRGMQISTMKGRGKHAPITFYDPATLAVTRHYDCVVARETFYRVADKEKFFAAIVAACRPHAQISFTDYVIEDGKEADPAILAWQAFEKGAKPLSVSGMSKAWRQHKVVLRVSNDQTAMYQAEVVLGLKRLETFLKQGVETDDATRASLVKRVQTWTYRISALNHGLKFYRFYGTLG